MLFFFACKKNETTSNDITPIDKVFIPEEDVWYPLYEDLKVFYDSGYNVIDADITISGIDSLTNLNFLSNVRSINGIFRIYDNKNLLSLEGLNSIESIGSLLIGHQNDFFVSNLINLNGINNLKKITGSLLVGYNNKLIDISGLETLQYIGFNCIIRDNNILSNLDGLHSLTFVVKDLVIVSNDSLTDLCAITELFVVGRVNELVNIGGNAFNPTVEDIKAGNCSQ